MLRQWDEPVDIKDKLMDELSQSYFIWIYIA